MALWCLHGNIQLPSVWHQFEQAWKLTNESDYVSLNCPSLWGSLPDGFTAWTHWFFQQIEKDSNDEPRFLLGYSLGGRLALHALIAKPELWDGAIIIGAHPGLKTDSDRQHQLARDRQWGTNFLEGEWDDILATWDALPVFCRRPHPHIRRQADFSKEKIAYCFDVFSKGRQADLTPELAKLDSPPVLYISGEDDIKYASIGDKLSRICPALDHVSIPEAGHRVPWENPDAFVQTVQRFLSNCIS